MKFKGDIIITDPCYIIKDETDVSKTASRPKDDWDNCGYGENMGVLGLNNYLVRDTIYGDWSCTTYEKGTKKVLGKFCADAGLVGVFLLDEVLKYNPAYDDHLKKDWCATLIKDFDGEVEFVVKNDEVSVVGKGNINFFTKQTGA